MTVGRFSSTAKFGKIDEIGSLRDNSLYFYMRIVTGIFLLFCLFLPPKGQCQSLLPPGLPEITLVSHDDSQICDYLFTEALQWTTQGAPSLSLMLDRNGEVAWYTSSSVTMTNFALLGNGQLSFFTQGEHLLLDSTMTIVGGLGCDGGYSNDSHDLIILPDGRTFLLCVEETSGVDLSGLHTRYGDPGSSNGILYSSVIQELDAAGDLVKEWRGRPFYTLTDVDTFFFTNPSRLALNHPNSIDWDGKHMLVSHRNNNELLLIDWDSGNIVWRLGGTYNQFTFVNDQGLHGQHDARFLGNNRISVFDNGVGHNPPVTRGLIYTVDTVNMTVTRDHEYPAPGNVIAESMGGFRVLSNGDVLRSNGNSAHTYTDNVSLIHADGSPAIDINYSGAYWSYRAQCHSPSWRLPRPAIQCIPEGNGLRLSLDSAYSSYLWTTGATTPSILVTDTGRYQVFVPYGIGQMGSFVFQVDELNGQCPAVSSTEPQMGRPRPAKLIRTTDLLGREVRRPERGQVYIEVYSNGRVRKVVQQ
jgi:hypothetical protein